MSDEERVDYLKMLVEDYFTIPNSKEILQLKQYTCINCENKQRVINTTDILAEMHNVIKYKKLSDYDTIVAIGDLYNQYFKIGGPF